MEVCHQEVVQHGEAFQTEAVKTAMQCLCWLVKSEIPHTGNSESLLNAVHFMGCEQLMHLNQGENAKYTSQRIIQDFLEVMAVQIEHQMLRNVRGGYFSVMIDKSTDIALCKELVMYAHYLLPDATVGTAFVTISELFNGTAETIGGKCFFP